MRALTIVVAVMLTGCGPSDRDLALCAGVPQCLQSGGCNAVCVDEAKRCGDTPDCYDGLICDDHCREIADCCECLSELDCFCENLTENRCVENLEADATICVTGVDAPADCATQDSRCGSACGFLVSRD